VTQLRETGPFERMLTLTIPPEALEAGRRSAAARLAKEAKVKGFRPGKAPLKVVESLVGVEVLRKEAIDDALPRVLNAALEAEDLMPAVPPLLTDVRDGGEAVEVDLLVTLWPTLTEVPEYAGMKVEVEIPEVTDTDVTNQVERMRHQFAELDDVSREGFDGDLVLVDVTTTLDGAAYARVPPRTCCSRSDRAPFSRGWTRHCAARPRGRSSPSTPRCPTGSERKGAGR
jgi:trigger factor